MTVPTTSRRVDYTGDGTQSTYVVPFRFFSADDLVVTKNVGGVLTPLLNIVDFLTTGAGLYSGGSLALTAGNLANGAKLTIRGKPVLQQATDLKNRGDFYPEDHEAVFDRLTQIDIGQQDELNRSIRFPETDGVAINNILPIASERANKFFACDGNGGVIMSAGGISSSIPVSAYGQTLIDDADAATARETLGFSKAALPAAHAAVGAPLNFSFGAPAVAGNALTMSVKGADGNNPSATNPVYVPFRSVTAGSGAVLWRVITAALSFTASNGSTFGHNSGLKQYLYQYLIDNAGAVEYAMSSKFFGWHGIVSTTAEGGAGAADSGTVMYSQTARANVPFICVGMTEDTQPAAGAWTVAPSMVHPAPFTTPHITCHAHKNGSDQVGVVSGVDTKVTFGTEVYDNGGLYDAANSRVTPPPGTWKTGANIRFNAVADQTSIDLKIYKNGVEYRTERTVSSGIGVHSASIRIEDECNGTDFYEIFVSQNSGSNQTISGSTAYTFVYGSWSPMRS